jgi:tetratricopeptide (TPR) repeat protein
VPILFFRGVAFADEGIPPAISVAIVRSVPDGATAEAENGEARDLMDQLCTILADESFDPKIMESQAPEEVLRNDDSVELVVSSAFQLKPVVPFRLTLHWRPDQSEGFGSTEGSENPVSEAAYEMIDHVKRSAIVRQIVEARSDRMRGVSSTSDNSIADGSLSPEVANQVYDDAVNEAFRRRYDGDFAGAIASITKAREVDPVRAKNDANSLFLLGLCHKELGEFSEARTAFQSAADADERHDGALLELGNLEYELGKYALAAHFYNGVIKANKTNAIRGRWNLGLALFQNHEYDEAIETIKPLEANSFYSSRVPYQLDRIGAKQAEEAARLNAISEYEEKQERIREDRELFLAKMYRVLAGAATFVVISIIITMIVVMYRRAQRDPALTTEQRLEFAGKLMSGLFSMLSLVGGTMLGLLIAG